MEWVRDHGITPEAAPTVDIYLPCCKEPLAILENTYKYVQKLEYPEGRMKVWVLDDGGQPEVAVLASQYGFNYICRDDRGRLKKAGNLRWAFARTTGDFFVIYDAASVLIISASDVLIFLFRISALAMITLRNSSPE